MVLVVYAYNIFLEGRLNQKRSFTKKVVAVSKIDLLEKARKEQLQGLTAMRCVSLCAISNFTTSMLRIFLIMLSFYWY